MTACATGSIPGLLTCARVSTPCRVCARPDVYDQTISNLKTKLIQLIGSDFSSECPPQEFYMTENSRHRAIKFTHNVISLFKR